jgi:hypothetical protein
MERRQIVNFLRTTTYKDSWYALPREKRSEIAAAAVAFHEKYLKAGILKDTYTFADGKLMSIWNVASLEEMATIMFEHPYSGLVDSETLPFLDHQAVVKLLNERREAAKKAAKK